MYIDVIVFTPSAPVWYVQGHALHLYIMSDAGVPWFGPIPPIGHQETQKGYQNDVNNDGAGAKAMMDVTITADNKAATTSIKEDEGNHLW